MQQPLKLSHAQLLKADKDHAQAARAGHLLYVSGRETGIERKQKGKEFIYTNLNKIVREVECLARIKALAIPPSWTNVWICRKANGHIQATGYDLKGRKQYRYHKDWHKLRGETKFHRLYEFGKTLPRLRKKVRSDLKLKGMTEEKALATAISLMEKTYIRVGNNDYEKKYGSYGLTTLQDKHVIIRRDQLSFSFIGKKGIEHKITLKNKQLARVVKQCRDIPGKTLFQYYDEEGNRKHIDSGSLNNYIKEVTGLDFSAKDFRTWAGSLQALKSFHSMGEAEDKSSQKKNITNMLAVVSAKLGNSPNICRKYYIHPGLINLYEEKKLFTNGVSAPPATGGGGGLSEEEKLLLSTLKKCF